MDSVRFVVSVNGEKYIERFGIEPLEDDNFDFKSDAWLAILGNYLLEPRIDPSGIGRTVALKFTGVRDTTTYDLAAYQADQQK